MISPIFASLRPEQWKTNLLMFIPLIFAEKTVIGSWQALGYLLMGFLTLCGMTGSVCLFNDLIDLPKDRTNPFKCNRPIAAGLLPIKDAKFSFLLILVASLFAAWKISALFFGIALGYFMLNLAYCLKLKKLVPLNFICKAFEAVLKTAAGVGALRMVAPDMEVSSWFVIIPFAFSMIGVLARRRQEIATREDSGIVKIGNFEDCSFEFLERGITIFSCFALTSYCFFTINPDMVAKFGNSLVYTNFVAVYCLLRYLYNLDKDREQD